MLSRLFTFFLLLLGLVAGEAALPDLRITTTVEGVHRLGVETLAPWFGLSESATRERIQAGGFQLTRRGVPVPWLGAADGSEIFFHAEAVWNNYTTQNIFLLAEGTNALPDFMDAGAPSPLAGSWYMAQQEFEQDIWARYELGSHPDSNYWYWASLIGGHIVRGKLEQGFMLGAPGPTNANLTARVSVRVHGSTTAAHTLAVAVNGVTNAAWVGLWTNKVPAQFTFEIPAALLKEGSNFIRFSALGTFATQWWLDGFTLAYPRPDVASSGRLTLTANSNSVVTVGGFTQANLRAVELPPGSSPRWLTNLTIQGAGSAWQASFAPATPVARYALWQAGSALPVAGIEAVWPAGLRAATNRAKCLLIAPAALAAAAQPLASYRNRQGLETRVVSFEAICHEFNGGLREPEAIRTFLAYARSEWQVKPAYVLLLGNGTYDYRNLRHNGDNLVPPLMIPTLFGLAASDSDLGDVGPAPGPEVAVGRLPVTNATQLAAVIAKIQAIESAPAATQRSAILMADQPDAAGDFVADLAQVSATLGTNTLQHPILPNGSNTLAMRNELLTNLTAGAELFCYLGHGASDKLGNAGYLVANDVSALVNAPRPPLTLAITCLSGFFAEPAYDCLAEALLLSPGGGAGAVLSASGFSLNNEATELNLALIRWLASGTPGRLGDYLRWARADYDQTPHFTPSGMYNLIGDPAMLCRSGTFPAPLAPVISQPARSADGTVSLTLAAQPGSLFTLRATTDASLPLSNWEILSQGVVPFDPWVFSDVGATNLSRRFYHLGTTGP